VSEADDEIARGAAKLHDREAAAARASRDAKEAADIEAARAGQQELAVRAAVLKRTLGPPMKDRWIVAIVMLSFVGLGLAMVPFGKHLTFKIIMAGSVAAMVVMLGLPILIPSLIAKARLARLDRIGHGVDVTYYRYLMSLHRRAARVVLVLDFAGAIDPAKRTQFADALRGWVPELETAEWEGDALKATSAELEGRISLFSKFGSSRLYTNQRFHGVVMHTVHDALPKLDAVAHVERLEIQLVGAVEKWDEPA
jgi:hypothetical protein